MSRRIARSRLRSGEIQVRIRTSAKPVAQPVPGEPHFDIFPGRLQNRQSLSYNAVAFRGLFR